jgi:hypothetical protein
MALTCSFCGAENDPEADFCAKCRTELTVPDDDTEITEVEEVEVELPAPPVEPRAEEPPASRTPTQRPSGVPVVPILLGSISVLVGVVSIGVIVLLIWMPKEASVVPDPATPVQIQPPKSLGLYRWKNGIGVHLSRSSVTFVEPMSPAEQSGIRRRDLVMIGRFEDEKFRETADLVEVVRNMKPGMKLQVHVKRRDGSYASLWFTLE